MELKAKDVPNKQMTNAKSNSVTYCIIHMFNNSDIISDSIQM